MKASYEQAKKIQDLKAEGEARVAAKAAMKDKYDNAVEFGIPAGASAIASAFGYPTDGAPGSEEAGKKVPKLVQDADKRLQGLKDEGEARIAEREAMAEAQKIYDLKQVHCKTVLSNFQLFVSVLDNLSIFDERDERDERDANETNRCSDRHYSRLAVQQIRLQTRPLFPPPHSRPAALVRQYGGKTIADRAAMKAGQLRAGQEDPGAHRRGCGARGLA